MSTSTTTPDEQAAAATASDPIVSPPVSVRVCKHMNDDHAVSVYGMARDHEGWNNTKISNAKLKSITSTHYTLSYVTCSGDVCTMQGDVTIPFDPPLKDAKEIKSRLIAEHHRVLSPQFKTLITDPVCIVIIGLSILLGILRSYQYPDLNYSVASLFGPITDVVGLSFDLYMRFCWAFLIVAHSLEACYAVYLCKKMKLRHRTVASWWLFVILTGYAHTSRIMELARVDAKEKKNH
uniref:DUF2470 domain-containing protein n=1 Tax=Leptocylindrus danicus TaxID=163516 RepID=A0A7S2KHE9_9STRA|mmetsp:Transcript_22876/g.34340  ORF Transcript_22876/g.34340 Transcript_22876/m.34340 type:complete len:236 (+) Transcript_22876:54-761(+)